MEEATNLEALTFEESYIEAGGFRIKCLAAGQGDPVVILDGPSAGISKLRDALVKRYRIAVLELPGFGSSPANTDSSPPRSLAWPRSPVIRPLRSPALRGGESQADGATRSGVESQESCGLRGGPRKGAHNVIWTHEDDRIQGLDFHHTTDSSAVASRPSCDRSRTQ